MTDNPDGARKDRMENIRAVIFDMDGTLIDSEKIFYRCWKQAAKEAGYDLAHDHILMLRSLAAPRGAVLMKGFYGEDFDFMAIRQRRRELVTAEIKAQGVVKKPGVVETLSGLKKMGYRLAVATATDTAYAIPYLKEIGIYEYFEKIICTSMVKEGKPAPDIYLYCCEQMKEKPENCLAVEDAPNGIRSAFSAGCHVVMVPDLSQPEENLLSMIEKTVPIMTDLLDLLQKY